MVGKKTEKSQSWTRSTEQAEDIIALMSANTICSSSLHPHKLQIQLVHERQDLFVDLRGEALGDGGPQDQGPDEQ